MDIDNLPKPWTKRQYKFALAYIENPVATEAAIKAGYSKKTAGAIGSRMLNDVNFLHVASFIVERTKKVIDEYETNAERILRELAFSAHSNILDYLVINQNDGLPHVDMRKVTREQAAAISKIKVKELPPVKMVENGEEIAREVLSVELSLWDKNKALEVLGRFKKLEKAVEVNVNHTGKVEYGLEEFARRMAFVLAKAAKAGNNSPKGGSKNAPTDTQKGDPHGPSV